MRGRRTLWLYVGIDTSLQSAVLDPQNCDEDGLPDDCDDESIQLYDGVDITPYDGEPLLFFYDCETTGGSYHHDHIIEVAATVKVPDDLQITSTQFSSLCHSSRHIAWKGNKYTTCASKTPFLFYQYQKNVGSHHTYMLYNQPMFSMVLQKLLNWMSSCIGEVEQKEVHHITLV